MKQVILFVTLLFGLLANFQCITLAQTSTASSECKNECVTCTSVCEQTLNHCLKHKGKHTEPSHIKALKRLHKYLQAKC